MRTNKYYIVAPIFGAYMFIENVEKTPVEAMRRLEKVRESIPSAILSTPMAYRAIWSQQVLVDNDQYVGNVLYSRCIAFVGANRANSAQRALGIFRILRRSMAKMISKGYSHQSALAEITLSLGTD